MKRIIVIGSLAYDRIMDFPGLFKDHFLPDKLHNISVSFSVKTPRREFGGCAGNIAYNLKLLEEEPEILATAGNDFDAYRAWMTQNGIESDTIQIFDTTTTASAYIMTDQGDNQITAFSASADLERYSLPFFADASAVAIIAPTGANNMRQFPPAFKSMGVPYLFDPGQQIPALEKEDLCGAIEGAEAMFVNDYELALVVSKTGWSKTDIASRLGTLIVTLGAKGSRIITKDSEEEVAAVKVLKAPDPTGAGDAYRAGFLKGRSLGLSLRECVQLGSVVAAYAVEHEGTQTYRFTLKEVKQRYEEAYGSPLVVS